MEIFPAIDLKDGRVVRLTQGDFDKVDVYVDAPLEVSKYFGACGAKNLHVVDLDGARGGEIKNFEVIRKIVEESGLFVQVGGGIRDDMRIRRYLDIGVKRVILGTTALEDFDFTCDMVRNYGEKIAVGVDSRYGKMAIRGWLCNTEENSFDFCQKLSEAGVATIIYTDIEKDGTMEGANLETYARLSTLKSNIVASGGISTIEELLKLKEMGIYGAVLGKALYLQILDLGEVIRIC